MGAPVIDSYALLAYLRDEPGAEIVQNLFEKAGRRGVSVFMSEVNYAEVQYIIRRKSGDAAWEQVETAWENLPIQLVPTSRSLADLAAGFKTRFKLSLADAFAAALAKEKKVELITGDPEFKALEKEIKIGWLLT